MDNWKALDLAGGPLHSYLMFGINSPGEPDGVAPCHPRPSDPILLPDRFPLIGV